MLPARSFVLLGCPYISSDDRIVVFFDIQRIECDIFIKMFTINAGVVMDVYTQCD